jgi:hypothetical protein
MNFEDQFMELNDTWKRWVEARGGRFIGVQQSLLSEELIEPYIMFLDGRGNRYNMSVSKFTEEYLDRVFAVAAQPKREAPQVGYAISKMKELAAHLHSLANQIEEAVKLYES